MRIKALKIAFILAGFVALVIILSSLFPILPSRSSESFSELYILGKDHMAENFPSAIKENEKYSVFLGVGNHVGSSTNYAIYMKLRNQNESAPIIKDGVPSPLPALHNYTIFLSNDKYWETPIDFRFSGFRFAENICTIENMMIDNTIINITKTALWNPEKKGFYLQLFFELWMQDSGYNKFQFQSKYVGIWLNITHS